MPELFPAGFPSPDTLHPIVTRDGQPHRGTVFLRPALRHPRIEVGDYSYASCHVPPADWAAQIAPYLYDFSPERLVIGRFCQFADGVQFITASANHRHDGFSSFPFLAFGADPAQSASMPPPGPDTVIGNDVWLGQGVRVLPGARIGDGCIVGAGAVVGGTLAPYSVVAGNPARLLRRRFPEPVIARLLQIRWWDWPIDHILDAEAAICGADLPALERVAARLSR